MFDALTANPATKQLFLFQSTLLDPLRHPIKMTPFVKILSNIQLTEPSSIDDIFFFMVTSAHSDIKSQHFFSFELDWGFHLNACYLQGYASHVGQSALRKVVFVDSSSREVSAVPLTKEEKIGISVEEMKILKTIRQFNKEGMMHKFRLPQHLYDTLFTFVNFASKIRPYICRAAFLKSEVSGQ